MSHTKTQKKATPKKQPKPNKPPIEPKTVPFREAMERTRLSRSTLDGMIDRGVFTILAPQGRGIGKRLYFRTDELNVYAETRDEEAVRKFREEQAAARN